MKIYENRWKSQRMYGNLLKSKRDLLKNYENQGEP